MTVPALDALYMPWQPALAGVRGLLQDQIVIGAVPLRVDVDVIDGEMSAPMCLLERGGLSLLAGSQAAADDVVILEVRATFLGISIDQVDSIRSRALRVLTGRGRSGFFQPLSVAGMVVVDRRRVLDSLPRPTIGGGWANAVLPVNLLLQAVADPDSTPGGGNPVYVALAAAATAAVTGAATRTRYIAATVPATAGVTAAAGSSPAAGAVQVPVTAGVTAGAARTVTGAAQITATAAVTAAVPSGAVTHGVQLTQGMVGPWALQGVAQGSETLNTPALPEQGYWRINEPETYSPAGTYVYNNDPSNHGGTVPAGGLTIDGYAVAAGTRVAQFQDFSASNFYLNGMSDIVLFRGCRFRRAQDATGAFNDNNSTWTGSIHYCDFGSTGTSDALVNECCLKFIGGQNHRVLRSNFSRSVTYVQPNVNGCVIVENYMDDGVYYYGAAGPPGGGGPYHLNGISCEGGVSNLTIARNHILWPSPDPLGRVIGQTDCIALFGTNGGTYSNVLCDSNLLGGAGYCAYGGGEVAGATNVVWSNNSITTRWWTDGGAFGEMASPPPFGTAGNVSSNNTYLDDYGTGGDGNTPTASRQYPAGNGPRVGATAF